MITLRAFQSGGGVPLRDQILLIDNPAFAKGYHQCLRICSKTLDTTKLGRFSARLARRLGLAEIFQGVNLPSSHEGRLFLGYPHRSFDDLSLLPELFEKIAARSGSTYVLMLGKGDYDFKEEYVGLIPENLACVAANNADLATGKVMYMPMGRDFRSREVFGAFPPVPEKSITAYCNFSVTTHPVRSQVFEMLKDKPFVEFDHMGTFRSYSITREEFFGKLRGSKFSICPRGNAIDTFRMWDSLYVGTIPIVVREARYHDQLADLPILFLESYDEFSGLTEDYLNQKYDEFLDREFNYDKLRLDYWVQLLESKLQAAGQQEAAETTEQ